MPRNEKSDDLQLIANLIRFLYMKVRLSVEFFCRTIFFVAFDAIIKYNVASAVKQHNSHSMRWQKGCSLES